MTWRFFLMVLMTVPWMGLARGAEGADEDPADKPLPAPKGTRGIDMDYGPVLASSLSVADAKGKRQWIVHKGLTIRLDDGVYAAFDTELMRYAAVWEGKFLDLTRTHLSTFKGSDPPAIGGTPIFSTSVGPGWADAKGSFEDPRNDPAAPLLGPLAKGHAHYKGYHRFGPTVILEYTVGETRASEMPTAKRVGGAIVFARTFNVKASPRPLRLKVAEGDEGVIGIEGLAAEVKTDGAVRFIELPPSALVRVFRVSLASKPVAELSKALRAIVNPEDIGGMAAAVEVIVTQGVVAPTPTAPDAFPYVVDTLTLPFENPWKSWIRPTAIDVFASGNAIALATWNGDVWIVSGIDDKLEKLTWWRFASGLYEPLGLKIVGDSIYVLGRDQITRLRHRNGLGQADFYENFNNDGPTCPQYHHFKFDLDTDPQGNFYYAVTGAWNMPPYYSTHSRLAKISADGSKSEFFARGFRAPNGMAVGPNGEIVTGDNQGHWMPTSKINYIPAGKTDGFYGYPYEPRLEKQLNLKKLFPGGVPKTFEPPLCWIPYHLDNSSGGQVFVTSDKWGPFKGNILHTSYGASALFMVMPEVRPGLWQGGLWRFPLAFEGGIMRARFGPVDGQLYVAGMRGWQTNSAKEGCLQRVRYTGGPVRMPASMRVDKKGIYITFAAALDPETANDTGSWDIEQWNYKWSAAYGSPEMSVENPTKRGRDTVDVKAAKLQADQRTVFLEIPDIRPVMQMGITYKLRGADGKKVEGVLYNTINGL